MVITSARPSSSASGLGGVGTGDVKTKFSLTLLPALLTIVCASGVLIIAVAFAGARESRSWADATLWIGMLVIVLPVTLRLIGASASRGERLYLVILLGLALYSVQVLLSPNQFVLHDELGAYRTIADILRTGALYSPRNPNDPAYSAYPGIVSATAALSAMSGWGIVPCGLVLVGAAKALTMGGLFVFIERCTRSYRVAGVAVALYTVNPNFVYFDSQFAYESLALGLAALTLCTMVRAGDGAQGGWSDVVLAAMLDGAVVLTHHLTSYAVTIASCGWAIAVVSGHRQTPAARRAIVLAIFSLGITLAYFFSHQHATESDIGGSIVGSLRGLYQVISGTAHGKAPFTSAAGYTNPVLEQITGLLSVALLMLAWPIGLLVAWQRRRAGPGVLILGLVSVLYPASLALRLTAAGSETSDRTSEFLFAGVAASFALAFMVWTFRYIDRPGPRAMIIRMLAVVYVGLAFAGGLTVGNPPYDMLPAGYLVGADNRSIDPEGVAAAHRAAARPTARHQPRAAARLTPSRYFLGDEADSELMTAYTRLRPQSGSVDGVGVGDVLVAPVFGSRELRMIEVDKLDYLVVDRRDSTALPHSGHYFDGGDPEVYSAPVSLQGLTKFNSNPCADRIFSSGNVIIYSTARILSGCY